MSTTENNIDATVEPTLDDFAANLFGGSKAQPSDDATSEEVETEVEADSDAHEEEDTHSADDGATEEADEADEEEPDTTDEDEQPKKGNRFQERINELTAARREAERKASELERKLDDVLKRLDEDRKTKEPEPTNPVQQEAATSGAPSPTDKNSDGTDKYPLGEFDPKFLRDTVQHMLDQKEQEQRKAQEEQAKQQEFQQQRSELQESWNNKLVDAQERYPDFQEKGQQMLGVFEGIDEQYGQYLTDTIMEMDAGPDVFYYLANNLEEAEKIVSAGPRKATIALAKLEAKFVSANTETKPVRAKTTKAPPPPPQLKGSSVARASVPIDTDDLDAFTKALFTKKK